MSKVTLVSAAVLLRASDGAPPGVRDEFLLARRPEGKVYAGWWEFPGGKVEPGETFRDALVRELHEELGIAITAATPWLTREFVYPHATVRIRFFRVTAWDGEIHPHEHDAVAWLRADAPPTVEPILPANGPILKGLALPTLCALTNAEENGVDAELARLEGALAGGLRFVQVRDKTLPAAERERLAQGVVARAKPAGAIVVVNDDAALAQRVGADGVHLSADALNGCAQRPDFAWVGASCHTAEELDKAAALELDYALLGPVLPTPTHPQAAGLGWDAFAQLVERSPLPVLALGGMRPAMMDAAWAHGAHGIALLRGWA
ncbi:Nudix family hydrolase [Azospira restricta]|uniref:8-oxo-dGTP diphosphatase n=1 Tax=Azospira restricta TaxID=404405 RepID=A0A974SPA5_9RHOO|nr:Nudix family hydrolase [Azospira restricta]QRJ63983.1 Nudix family hydrolase [Azospira restricta]